MFWNTVFTAVGLLLIRLVLAVCHAVAGQAVVDAVSVATLKVLHAATGDVQRWERPNYSFILPFEDQYTPPRTNCYIMSIVRLSHLNKCCPRGVSGLRGNCS